MPTDARLWLATAAVLAGVYGLFWHSSDWNTSSRRLVTEALVRDGAVEITPWVAAPGRVGLAEPIPKPPTWDMSSPTPGRFYGDKAPGQSILGVPAVWLATRVAGVPFTATAAERGPNEEMPPFSRLEYWATWTTSGWLTAATAVLLGVTLRDFGVSKSVAVSLALVYGLATPALVYATLFYGHASAGFFTLLALILAFGRRPAETPWYRWLAAGAAAGAAVCTEYPLAVLVAVTVVIAVGLAVSSRSGPTRLQLAAYGLGGLPFAVALGAYHYAATGNALDFPYNYEVHPDFAFHRAGPPISAPAWSAVFGLLAGSARGLLWYAPLLLLAPFGLWTLGRQGRTPLALALLGVSAGVIALSAGFPKWEGGLATGPRFLVPILPLLMLAAGVGFHSLRAWFWRVFILLATAAGGVLVQGSQLVGGRVPTMPRPWSDWVAPRLAAGQTEPNLLATLLPSAGGWGQLAGLAAVTFALVVAFARWARQIDKDQCPAAEKPDSAK